MHLYRKIYMLFLVLILITISAVKSQNINQSLPFSIQINVNVNNALSELSGNNFISESVYEGKTFGADKGIGVSVYFKIRTGEKSRFYFVQALSYNRIMSYDFNKLKYDAGEVNYEASTLSLGMEYDISPSSGYKIYLGPEFNASLISGDAKIWFERRGNLLGDSVANYDITSSFRIGFGVNVGAVYKLNKLLGLNAGVKFLNLNLLLKNTEGKNDDSDFKLRDADNPDLIFSGNKSFSLISVYMGIALSF